MDADSFVETCAAIGLPLKRVQIEAFETFEQDLYEVNASVNLTRVPQAECWLRHFVDSLLVAEFLPSGAHVLDIGTGPGFPAWPLACARPDLAVTALDSNGKMLSFLERHPLPNLRIVQGRAEDTPPRESYDVVTGRAVAPIMAQLEISAAPCKIGGAVVPMRTPTDEPFPTAPPPFGLALEQVVRRPLPSSDIIRVFPVYRKVTPTSPRYPRRWADIRKGSPT